jgi:hypothetical protein
MPTTTAENTENTMQDSEEADEKYGDEQPTLIAERKAQRRYFRHFLAHPDPRDPDFPGYPDDEDD